MLSGNGNLSSRQVWNASSEVERKGFSGIWFGETTVRDAFVLATIALCSTKKIDVGTSIVNVFTRSPGQLAMAGETLNELGEGRFTLGLGVSTAAIVEGWHGQPFGDPVKRLEEVVKLLRHYLSGEKFGFNGSFFSPTTAKLRIGQPPEIALAALNNGMIEKAAVLADRVILNLYPTERIQHARRLMDSACLKAGKKKRPALSVMLYSHVLGDNEPGVEAAKDLVSFYSSAPAYSQFFSSIGFSEQARGMLEAWEAKDREAVKRRITREMIDAIMVVGTVKELRERVMAYHESGVDEVCICPSPFGEYEANIKEILASYN